MSPEVACGTPVVPSGTTVSVCALMSAPREMRNFEGVRMIFQHRPHQCGLPSHGFASVDIGAMIQKSSHGLDSTGSGRGHECRLPAGIG